MPLQFENSSLLVNMQLRVLSFLENANLLTEEIKRSIKKHPFPWVLLGVFDLLEQNKLLTKSTLSEILEHTYPQGVAFGLTLLQAAELLTLENVQLMLAPSKSFLLANEARTTLWASHPANELTQSRLLAVYQATTLDQAILRYNTLMEHEEKKRSCNP